MTIQDAFPSLEDRPLLKVYRELGVTPTAPEIEERSLADYVEEHAMAPYIVPWSVHFHDALPLTAVGKLDKKALLPAKAG